MGADRFWGRVFRSKYFQGGIGLSERQREANDEEASAFIASFLKEAVNSTLLLLLLLRLLLLLLYSLGHCVAATSPREAPQQQRA